MERVLRWALEDTLVLCVALDEPDVDTLAMVEEEDELLCESGELEADEEEDGELEALLLTESEDDEEVTDDWLVVDPALAREVGVAPTTCVAVAVTEVVAVTVVRTVLVVGLITTNVRASKAAGVSVAERAGFSKVSVYVAAGKSLLMMVGQSRRMYCVEPVRILHVLVISPLMISGVYADAVRYEHCSLVTVLSQLLGQTLVCMKTVHGEGRRAVNEPCKAR